MENYNTIIDLELENHSFIENVPQRLYNTYMALCYGEKYKDENYVTIIPYSMVEARYNELHAEPIIEETPITEYLKNI